MKCELHIITNCIKASPATTFINFTYQSFVKAFGELPVVVWCDPHPKVETFEAYCQNMKTLGFTDIRKTGSLAESYLGVIEQCKADYAFVLEHDWLFCHERIKHSLNEILDVMKKEGLYYLRFNQVANYVRGWDRVLTEKDYNGFKYLETNCWSGNPHILDIKKCRALNIPDMIRNRGNKTPEKKLTDDGDLSGYIYGPLNYKETIVHLDGRQHTPKPHWTPRQCRMMKNKNLHRIIKIAVCMPWHDTGCPYRDQAKKFVEKHYSEYPIHIGSIQNGKKFNRSALLNMAANNALHMDPDLEVLFFVDADTFVPMNQVIIACCLAKTEQRLVLPYDLYVRLDHKATKIRLKHGVASTGKKIKNHVSGAIAVPVSLFKTVGGFDERFKGWGGEDRAFFFAAQTLTGGGDVLRVPGTGYHFYHPNSEDRNKHLPEYKKNIDLALRYKMASGITEKTGIIPAVKPHEPDNLKMLEILSEPGGPLFKKMGAV